MMSRDDIIARLRELDEAKLDGLWSAADAVRAVSTGHTAGKLVVTV